MSSKKITATAAATGPVNECEMMREDIVPFCSMITTTVVNGSVIKTGLICSKEKLQKLLTLPNIDVVEGDVEMIKIKGHQVIASVSANGHVIVSKTIKNESNNNNPNKQEEKKMSEEKKETKAATEVKNDQPAENAAAAPAEQKPAAGVTSVEQLFESKEANEIYQAIRKANSDSIEEMKANQDPLWKECLKGAAIGGAVAVGGLTVCAIWNAVFKD